MELRHEESSSLTAESSILLINEYDMKKTQAAAHTEARGSLAFWFKRSDFYVTGLDFVCSRIAIMTQSVAIAFYLQEVCHYKAPDLDHDGDGDGTPYQIAVATAVSFIASFVYSIFVQDRLQTYHQYDKYNLFLYSIAYFTVAGFILFFIVTDPRTSNGMVVNTSIWTPIMAYSGMFIQGCGMANMMNSSTSLVSEMIGHDDQASAIVFASFNIIESFSNGGVAYLLTTFDLVSDATAMRWILSVVPVACAVVAFVASYLRFKQRTVQFFAEQNPDVHEDAGYRSMRSRAYDSHYRSIA